jgi:hypothetical protein
MQKGWPAEVVRLRQSVAVLPCRKQPVFAAEKTRLGQNADTLPCRPAQIAFDIDAGRLGGDLRLKCERSVAQAGHRTQGLPVRGQRHVQSRARIGARRRHLEGLG